MDLWALPLGRTLLSHASGRWIGATPVGGLSPCRNGSDGAWYGFVGVASRTGPFHFTPSGAGPAPPVLPFARSPGLRGVVATVVLGRQERAGV